MRFHQIEPGYQTTLNQIRFLESLNTMRLTRLANRSIVLENDQPHRISLLSARAPDQPSSSCSSCVASVGTEKSSELETRERGHDENPLDTNLSFCSPHTHTHARAPKCPPRWYEREAFAILLTNQGGLLAGLADICNKMRDTCPPQPFWRYQPAMRRVLVGKSRHGGVYSGAAASIAAVIVLER